MAFGGAVFGAALTAVLPQGRRCGTTDVVRTEWMAVTQVANGEGINAADVMMLMLLMVRCNDSDKRFVCSGKWNTHTTRL